MRFVPPASVDPARTPRLGGRARLEGEGVGAARLEGEGAARREGVGAARLEGVGTTPAMTSHAREFAL